MVAEARRGDAVHPWRPQHLEHPRQGEQLEHADHRQVDTMLAQQHGQRMGEQPRRQALRAIQAGQQHQGRGVGPGQRACSRRGVTVALSDAALRAERRRNLAGFHGQPQHCRRVRGPDVEQEIQHVAVLDDVFLAFDAHLAGFLGAGFALAGDEVVVGDGLGADEAALEVGVDDAGRLRRGVAAVDGPGAHFLHAGGEVGLQAEQVVAGADQRGPDPVRAGPSARGTRPCRRRRGRRVPLRWRRRARRPRRLRRRRGRARRRGAGCSSKPSSATLAA